MAQFSIHAPKSSSTLRKSINMEKALSYTLPIGVISETLTASYGYDGDKYYVTCGFLSYLLFGRMSITLDEAKQCFNALNFANIDCVNIDFDNAKQVLKESRKLKLEGDELMFFFTDKL